MPEQNQSPEPEYVDDRQLAQLTPYTRAFFSLRRVRGGGPPFYKIGRRCLYKLAEVRAWIESHRVAGAS